jgi:hypothetical protein
MLKELVFDACSSARTIVNVNNKEHFNHYIGTRKLEHYKK